MKQKHLNRLCAGAFITLLAGGFSSCMEKDLFDPEWRKNQLPPESEYFDYSTRGSVKLEVNYNTPALKAYVEIYDQNPLEAKTGTASVAEGNVGENSPQVGNREQTYYVKKANLKPIYSAYTDGDGKLTANMYIPTAVTEAYLYTEHLGLPKCVKLVLNNGTATYDATKSAVTRAATMPVWGLSKNLFSEGKPPYDMRNVDSYQVREDKLYSICKWGNGGVIDNSINPSYIENAPQFENGETAQGILTRVSDYLGTLEQGDKRAELLITNPSIANVNIKEDGTALKVVFLSEAATFKNVFGYYYYKNDGFGDKGGYDMVRDLKKYIIFPNVSHDDPDYDLKYTNITLSCGNTVSLKYFGPDGNEEGTTTFPKGYTVGWFLHSNGYIMPGEGIYRAANKFQPEVCTHNGIREGRVNGNNGDWGSIKTTNDDAQFRRFISLADKKSNSVVIGIEDLTENADDYCDLMFLVKSNKEIFNPGQPEVDPTPVERKDVIEGTLAFEDVWPSGGDYDLNDVVVEYRREITFDKDNYATKSVETFRPVYNGATYINSFACQYAVSSNMKPEVGLLNETETKSIVIDRYIKDALGQSFTVTRTFDGKVNKDDVAKDFNPYIIVQGNRKEGRTEVHLPKHLPTSLANKDLNYTQDDAYYMDKDGKYPFAIDIPVIDFKVVEETKRIDDEIVGYPEFAKWAASKGTEYKDWYKKKK